MNKPIEQRLQNAIVDTDIINERLFLAIRKSDSKEIDNVARDMIQAGNVIKDLAYELRRKPSGGE